MITVDCEVLADHGYSEIVDQNEYGEVILRNDLSGRLELFQVRDSYAGWSIPTDCGRELEFVRSCDVECLEQVEPTEGDFTITPCGRLGGKSALGRVGGRFIGEFDCDDDAAREAQRIMTAESWFTNVWLVSDHGNWRLLTDWEG